MILDEILERNQAFVRGRTAKPLPAHDRVTLAVIACHDPRLDGLLREALGVAPGTAVLLRTAGAHVDRGGDPLRSLAVAAFRYGLTELLVVGHTSCRMASFRSSEFIEAFRARGVSREAFGVEDLREWVGAAADPRRGVVASVAAIRGAPFLPRDLRVTGAVLDDSTGALEIVARHGEALRGFDSLGVEAAPAETPEEPEPRPAPPPGESPDPVDRAIAVASKVRSKAHLRDDIARLGVEFRAAGGPIERLRLVESFLKRVGGEAREVRDAVVELRRRAATAPPADVAEDVVRRVVASLKEE